MSVELQVVLEQELQDNIDREDILVEIDAVANLLNFECNELPRGVMVVCDCVSVDLIDEVGPCRAYVRDAAVVGSVIDEQTDVVVCCLIGVVVVELRSMSVWRI